MLGKVLKYDLKYCYKVLIIFYVLGILSAVLTRIFSSFESSFIMTILGYISSAVTIIFIINILINTVMRLWNRLIKNVYGDESYLTHTIPVSKTTIMNSKFLSIIITLFTSILVILLILFIAYYTKDSFNYLKSLFNFYNVSWSFLMCSVSTMFFLEMVFVTIVGYFGIILGHQHLNKKVIWSLIIGLIAYMITNIFILAGVFLFGLYNPDIMNLFTTTEVIPVPVLRNLIVSCSFLYIFLVIVYYLLSIYYLKKGVNID